MSFTRRRDNMSIEPDNAFEEIKNIYLNNLNFSEELVDYLSNEDIIMTFVEGRYVSYIANKFCMEESDIENIIESYLGFTGWKYDLDFNPYDLYIASSKLFDDYIFNCYLVSPNFSQQLVLATYFICRVFDELKERMDNEYYRT